MGGGMDGKPSSCKRPMKNQLPKTRAKSRIKCGCGFHPSGPGTAAMNAELFSFRMISDTRIECQNANSQGEAT